MWNVVVLIRKRVCVTYWVSRNNTDWPLGSSSPRAVAIIGTGHRDKSRWAVGPLKNHDSVSEEKSRAGFLSPSDRDVSLPSGSYRWKLKPLLCPLSVLFLGAVNRAFIFPPKLTSELHSEPRWRRYSTAITLFNQHVLLNRGLKQNATTKNFFF